MYGTLLRVMAVFVGWLVLMVVLSVENMATAGAAPAERSARHRGDAAQGRQVYNGKGICYYCHGTDGHFAQRPQLNPDTKTVIDQLNPPPADLRNPASLKLKTDNERFRLIREGHLGTGMFPDSSLTDEEITHILAYLATLRQDASFKNTPGQR